MPITSIRLKNFKCFADSGEIPLRPLTIIFGRNNTGKSSILQPLLLLRQTLDSPEHGPTLNLRGPLYPAGVYGDIVHQHRAKAHVTMEFEVRQSEPRRLDGRIELEFSSQEPRPPRFTRVRVDPSSSAPLEIKRTRGAGGPFQLFFNGRPQGDERKANFYFPPNRFVPVIGSEPPRVGRPSPDRDRTRNDANNLLTEFVASLQRLRAVGAFRRQPERRYEFRGRVPDSVNSIGENVVDALIDDSTRRGRLRGELLAGVNQWLHQVGRVRLLPLRRISRSARIFELRLKDIDSGRWANFADVGFGIGQAFPVIVEGLRTPEGGTFLVQEPEIHLHPDAQLAMANFLVSLVREGRQVIAESHSEHLLLRIRHLIVGEKGGKRRSPRLSPGDVSIIFVEKGPSGESWTRVLDVDELGQIKNWPRGFLEDATRERIAFLGNVAALAERNGK